VSQEAKQKQAEELLEKALSVYGECEPPSDLEERIIRQVRAARSKRSPAWLPVLAAAAAILIGVVLIQDWREAQTPKTTTVVHSPAAVPRPAPPNVDQPSQTAHQVPRLVQRVPMARSAPAVNPEIPTEESAISPLPRSELDLSDIGSSPIDIEDLGKESIPVVSDMAGADSQDAPPAEELISGLEEEGRQR